MKGLLLVVIAVLALMGTAFAEIPEIPTKGAESLSEKCAFPSDCPTAGHIRYPHERDCRLYYECSNGRKCVMSCFEGYVFNPILDTCDLPKNVPNCMH
ncbi:chitin-binding domain protein cbd-1-like [Bombus pascuorum]|uniref:chitin-binding domain protein cbd-1-like n=1 Tax=Bombus pascuorum TaxID=65598 RepID=UPI00298DAF6D|nr:chitin-binding domain protein cbd-1-like [Bombus pascuorum]